MCSQAHERNSSNGNRVRTPKRSSDDPATFVGRYRQDEHLALAGLEILDVAVGVRCIQANAVARTLRVVGDGDAEAHGLAGKYRVGARETSARGQPGCAGTGASRRNPGRSGRTSVRTTGCCCSSSTEQHGERHEAEQRPTPVGVCRRARSRGSSCPDRYPGACAPSACTRWLARALSEETSPRGSREWPRNRGHAGIALPGCGIECCRLV